MISASLTHRTARGAARIDALAETAAEMFLEQGYGSVSLDTVIERVGGSRRNIYQHFGGKEGLFIAVVTRLCDEISQPLTSLEIDHKEARPALVDFGRKVLELVLQPRVLALHRLMTAEGQRFPQLAQAIWRSGHDTAIQTLAGWIERRRPTEFRRDVSAGTLAAQFVSMVVSGPQLRALVGLDPLPPHSGEIARLVEQAVDTFLLGALGKAGVHDA